LQDGIGARLGDRQVELPVGITGERDQAKFRMILSAPGDRGDAVDERHVQVDHDGVGVELVRELDRIEPVFDRSDDCSDSRNRASSAAKRTRTGAAVPPSGWSIKAVTLALRP
jgi:hypothetical protein